MEPLTSCGYQLPMHLATTDLATGHIFDFDYPLVPL